MKRFISFLLIFCLLTSAIPQNVFAEEINKNATSQKYFTDSWWNKGNMPDSFLKEDGYLSSSTPKAKADALLSDGTSQTAETASLTQLSIGIIDVFAVPVGNGWSFDAETNVLTLDNLTVFASETDACAIRAVGDLTITTTPDSTNTLSGTIGISVQGNLTISNANLTATGTNASGSGIDATGKISIINCNEIISSGDGTGISAGEVLISNSTVTATGSHFGLSALNGLTIDNSTVHADATATFETLLNSTYPLSFGVAAAAGELNITDSTVESNAAISPLIADVDVSAVTIENSTFTGNSQYMGLFINRLITINDSTIRISTQSTLTEKLDFSMTINFPIPPSSIIILDETGSFTASNSSFYTVNPWMGIAAPTVAFTSCELDMTGGFNGITAQYDLNINNCKSITIENNTSCVSEYIAAGQTINMTPTSILSNGNITITDCPSIHTSGSFAGMIASEGTLTITDSSSKAYGGYIGLGGSNIHIDKSNIHALCEWDESELQTWGVPRFLALTSSEPITLTNAFLEDNRTIGYFEETGDNYTLMSHTILDENQLPASSVVITADTGTTEEPEVPAIANGTCGENVMWTLDSEGALLIKPNTETQVTPKESSSAASVANTSNHNGTASALAASVSGTYSMDDFENAEDAPWHPYRDQIKSIIVSDQIANIGNNSFCNCANLETISLGEDVTSIGENAFSNCETITVEFKGDEPIVSDNAFAGSNTSITYPADNESWTNSSNQNNYGDTSTVTPQKPVGDTEDPCKDGHSFGEWYTSIEATCKTNGQERRDCANCECFTTRKTELTNHSFTNNKCTVCEFENPFVDISNSNYYFDAVIWAYENGITLGKDATHFNPNESCTRGQVVTFLWRANGCPEPKTTDNPFVDVASDKFYYKAVLWAYENGITSGKDATHFQPDTTVTRNQFVTFLWRAAGQPEPAINNPFTDVPDGQYYTKAVLWAFETGITTGKDATHFEPEKTCLRCQVAAFLYRAK